MEYNDFLESKRQLGGRFGFKPTLIEYEMSFAHTKYGIFHNSHEHYAVLQEEVDEWRDAVKGNTAGSQLDELLQAAAVALRYIFERGDASYIAEIQRRRHERG